MPIGTADSAEKQIQHTAVAKSVVQSHAHAVVWCGAQAGGENKAQDIKVPAGITRLFKSNLDWNLYSDDQKALDDRKVHQSPSRWFIFQYTTMHSACSPSAGTLLFLGCDRPAGSGRDFSGRETQRTVQSELYRQMRIPASLCFMGLLPLM